MSKYQSDERALELKEAEASGAIIRRVDYEQSKMCFRSMWEIKPKTDPWDFDKYVYEIADNFGREVSDNELEMVNMLGWVVKNQKTQEISRLQSGTYKSCLYEYSFLYKGKWVNWLNIPNDPGIGG